MVVFNLSRLNYERIKPDDVFVGVDLWATYAFASTNANYHKSLLTAIGEAEFHMGYNFLLASRNHLTPFLGVGVFGDFGNYSYEIERTYTYHYYTLYYEHEYTSTRTYHKSFHLPPLIYGTAGIKYDHEFNSIVNLGTNFKALIGGSTSSRKWENPIFGFECGIPLTLCFGKDRHWDFRFEPFDIFLINSDFYNNFFGIHLSFGYRY